MAQLNVSRIERSKVATTCSTRRRRPAQRNVKKGEGDGWIPLGGNANSRRRWLAFKYDVETQINQYVTGLGTPNNKWLETKFVKHHFFLIPTK